MSASPNELHAVFGAGQVGARLVTQLLAAAKRVRVVKHLYSALSRAGRDAISVGGTVQC